MITIAGFAFSTLELTSHGIMVCNSVVDTGTNQQTFNPSLQPEISERELNLQNFFDNV
jgi:hypothetical protein